MIYKLRGGVGDTTRMSWTLPLTYMLDMTGEFQEAEGLLCHPVVTRATEIVRGWVGFRFPTEIGCAGEDGY